MFCEPRHHLSFGLLVRDALAAIKLGAGLVDGGREASAPPGFLPRGGVRFFPCRGNGLLRDWHR